MKILQTLSLDFVEQHLNFEGLNLFYFDTSQLVLPNMLSYVKLYLFRKSQSRPPLQERSERNYTYARS